MQKRHQSIQHSCKELGFLYAYQGIHLSYIPFYTPIFRVFPHFVFSFLFFSSSVGYLFGSFFAFLLTPPLVRSISPLYFLEGWILVFWRILHLWVCLLMLDCSSAILGFSIRMVL
ncbi:uncharacterized protein CIMG_13285 [Coccidioides immitis RS]|uniref:Uncharacterized protein n=1 Tax=Coccidioides immitis (strain RS) TaxID=246410 RepID=A0A0D8JU44_COCIM|nr:uncharacterized protein CIMG_13285 [Coccidioides immitis RS]KJF60870.1 hypothetical protein CIMG_13285 [Coccidioides immitis RS]